MARKLVCFFIIPGILLVFAVSGISQVKKDDTKKTATAVGTETCLSCHPDYDAAISSSAHRTLLGKSSGKKSLLGGCEACHGAGSAHLENPGKEIINFKREDGRDFAKQCLTCHASNPLLSKWEHSDHNKGAVFCNECHKVHETKDGKAKAATTSSSKTCAKCHQDVEAQFKQPSHHPVPEKKMECASCHNPHSENTDATAFGSTNQTCVKCHAEKSGPFKYQHDPVAENCLSCHSPHGSASAKLTTVRVANLCVQCHTDALFTHKKPTPTTTIKNNCLDCHNKIHGSNANEKLLF